VLAVAAAAGLVLLAVVLIGVSVGGSNSVASNMPVSAPSSAAHGTPTTRAAVPVVADDLVGLPVADVKARLIASGLQVELRAAETADAPAGAVVSVTPLGPVAPGGWVTVTYATAPTTTPSPPPAPASASSAPVSSPAETSGAPGPGKGHGRGGGHGRNG
jgi:serine/threonine-protein kinase